ncbi:Iroquois-class homeodomain protein irx-1-A [Thelohanellus kitauei]|uniref:Iroquois-class homeodomain protein irx-1-A n=1 Tax=Thelohanellus kitauei TaxID=669202 RepID=A0A0C2MXJ2_THEKT|nr:Iroquois-class homeodomain protein irx-1-A [Thelohanellus kitauei]
MNPHINNNLQQRSGPMRAWLNTHLHDPYPSSQEKQKLADECNKTYIQVCTWFANARRSLRRQGIIGPRLRRTKTGSSKEFTDPGNANQRSKNGSNIQLNMNSFQIETEIAKSCQSVMPQVSSPSPIQLQAKKIHDL